MSDHSLALEKIVASLLPDSIGIFDDARETLARHLTQTGEPAFSWFYKTFLMTPGLRTRKPDELTTLFFASGVDLEMRRFLAPFPALEKLWILQIADCERFVTDFQKHSSSFAMGRKISGVAFGFSDSHNGGRTVSRVQFSDGENYFYKPRSGAQEKTWFELLTWMNSEGFAWPFQILEVHDAQDHCWVEEAFHAPCHQRREVASFYIRAGALLYLYFVFGGIDLHCANWIAAGENPVVVDCETLFHDPLFAPDFSIELERSVLRCGFLPMRRAQANIGVSALAPDCTGSHTTFLNKTPVSACQFVEEICEGFSYAHEFLTSDSIRGVRFSEIADSMALLTWRKVLRPTSVYYQALQRSLSPAVLRSNATRMENLRSSMSPDTPTLQAAEEIRSLERGDIPIFHGPAWRRVLIPTSRTVEESIRVIRASMRGATENVEASEV